ncbi:MAG TPA: hypothetical protein VNV44_09715 [Solirubrobacteraceae bacterium]|jgi:hypothetical protein|nr:hypothetical protein [Solirubrobacteraceae bacterium]
MSGYDIAMRTAAALAAAVALAMWAAPATAYWPAKGEATGSVALATLSAPAITSATAGGETVALAWSAVTPPGSGTVTYYVTRDGGAPSAACPGSIAPTSVTSCTDTGASVGSHEYTVTAVWRNWKSTSAAKSVTVVSGPATQLALEAASTHPAAGETDNLTITAKDAMGRTVTSYTGAHTLIFEGASAAPSGAKPVVVDAKGTEKALGESTEITFTEGRASVATAKNGALKLYRAGEAKVVVKEGTLSNGTGLPVTVSAGAFKSFSVSATPAEPEAGASTSLKLIAWDEWHNVITSYARTAKLHYEGAETSASGKGPEYSATTEPTFTSGEVTVAGFRLYKAGSTTVKVKEEGTTHEGSVTANVKPAAAARFGWTLPAVSAGTLSSPCLFACEDTALGNSHTFKAAVSVTDEYGNIETTLGTGHVVALAASAGTLSVAELAIASAGNATSAATFTFTSQSFGSGTDTIKASTKSGTTYTEATATLKY